VGEAGAKAPESPGPAHRWSPIFVRADCPYTGFRPVRPPKSASLFPYRNIQRMVTTESRQPDGPNQGEVGAIRGRDGMGKRASSSRGAVRRAVRMRDRTRRHGAAIMPGNGSASARDDVNNCT